MPRKRPLTKKQRRALQSELNARRKDGKRVTVLPTIRQSKRAEVEYRQALLQVTRELRQGVTDIVIAGVSTSADINGRMDALVRSANEALPLTVERIASDAVSAEARSTNRRFNSALERRLGSKSLSTRGAIVDPREFEDQLNAKITENVSYAQEYIEDYLGEARQTLLRELTQPTGDIRSALAKVGRKMDNRMITMSRDQIAKVNALVNQSRQEVLGVEEYVWRTVGDQRVRENHASKNGKIFKWSEPPADTGHPGWDYNCRCHAEAILVFE